MPSPERDGLIHKAVLWPFLRTDVQGEPVVGPGVEVDSRWLWGVSIGLGPEGESISNDVTIKIDQYVTVGSIMWQGTLKEWNALPPGSTDTWLVQVNSERIVEDIRGEEVGYKLGASRFRDSLPTVET